MVRGKLEVRNILFGFFIGMSLSALLSFTIVNYEITKATSEADLVQGVYIFVKCKPVKNYKFLGTVNAPYIGSHEFDDIVNSMLKNLKKHYPNANGLVFDGPIKQSHNTKASAILIEE